LYWSLVQSEQKMEGGGGKIPSSVTITAIINSPLPTLDGLFIVSSVASVAALASAKSPAAPAYIGTVIIYS